MVEFIEIEAKQCRELYGHMKKHFRRQELPPLFAIRRNVGNGVYSAFYLSVDGQNVGYAILTELEDSILINFLAMFEECRSKGFGAVFLEEMNRRHPEKLLVLEVEDPSGAKTPPERELMERRIGFYKRCGYVMLPTRKARIFGVDMLIMANKAVETASVRELVQAFYLRSLPSSLWLKNIDVIDC